MSKQQHTPAPWVVESRPGHDSYVTGGGSYRIARVIHGYAVEGKANARLIAAAPALLAALEAMVGQAEEPYHIDMFEATTHGAEALSSARAAIAQARGAAAAEAGAPDA